MISEEEEKVVNCKYDVIVVDPPWQYPYAMQGYKGLKTPYATLTTKQIAGMNVVTFCKTDTALFLWCTAKHMPDALHVMQQWGFRFVNIAFVWNKIHTTPGRYTMPQCEFVLLGITGTASNILKTYSNVRQYIEAPREGHSRKPAEFYERVRALFVNINVRTLELFARDPPVYLDTAYFWSRWGNECVTAPEQLNQLVHVPPSEVEVKKRVRAVEEAVELGDPRVFGVDDI